MFCLFLLDPFELDTLCHNVAQQDQTQLPTNYFQTPYFPSFVCFCVAAAF